MSLGKSLGIAGFLPPHAIDVRKHVVNLAFDIANVEDLPGIVELLADDPLGQGREDPTLPLATTYREAFDAIVADPNNTLIIARANDGIAGVLQLTFIPNLTYKGGWRAQIEGVRVAPHYRNLGVGRTLLGWAIDRARDRRCALVQLTTDRARPEAQAFYEALGFVASHTGLKLKLG